MSGSTTGLAPDFPDALATRDRWLEPFDWYRTMRRESPVRYDPSRGVWDVFRYDDVKHALSASDVFVSDPMTPYDDLGGAELMGETKPIILDTILASDPPQHTRLRSAAGGFFTDELVSSTEPTIRTLADELLETAATDGEFDLVREFASPLTMSVILDLLDLPRADCEQFIEWSEAFITAPVEWAEETVGTLQTRQLTAQQELLSYFERVLEERRDGDGDDLITALLAADHELSDRELLAFCIFLVFAGHVTTTNLIANTVRCLDAHPETIDRVANGSLPLESVIEETLRYRSPQHVALRAANEETELGDRTIERGDALVLWIGSANRDSTRFDGGDTFVPTRSPNSHLAFGHGSHYCLGSSLGRLEAEIAVTALLERFDQLSIRADHVAPTRSLFVYGTDALPVSYA